MLFLISLGNLETLVIFYKYWFEVSILYAMTKLIDFRNFLKIINLSNYLNYDFCPHETITILDHNNILDVFPWLYFYRSYVSILKIEVIKCLQYYCEDRAIIEHKKKFWRNASVYPLIKFNTKMWVQIIAPFWPWQVALINTSSGSRVNKSQTLSGLDNIKLN